MLEKTPCYSDSDIATTELFGDQRTADNMREINSVKSGETLAPTIGDQIGAECASDVLDASWYGAFRK